MVMLKVLGKQSRTADQETDGTGGCGGDWLEELWIDFRKRLVHLLGGSFKTYDCKFALAVLTNNIHKKKAQSECVCGWFVGTYVAT